MAFVEPEKKDELVEGGQSVATGPQAGGATLGGGEGGGSSNAAAPAEPAAGGSGGPKQNFVGLKTYLDANKPQSQKLATNVGGFVGEKTAAADKSLGEQTGLYNTAVDQNTVRVNQPLFKEAQTNTVGVAKDQQKLADFQRMRDAQYKGPQSFDTSDFYAPTKKATEAAQLAADNTQTEQGQRNLLTQFGQEKTGKTVGSGVNNFDQLLLQSGDSKGILANARSNQEAYQKRLQDANLASQAAAQKAVEETARTRQAVQDEFGTGASSQKGLEAQLGQRVQQAVGQSREKQAALSNALKTGATLSDQDLRILGVTPSQYQSMVAEMGSIDKARLGMAAQPLSWENSGGFSGEAPTATGGYDLSQYVTDQTGNINAQNVASADDYARYAALNDLMGTENKFLSDAALAGTADDGIGIDFSGINNYLAQQRAAAEVEQAKRIKNSGLGNLGNVNYQYNPQFKGGMGI